jgi:hypothetical protein
MKATVSCLGALVVALALAGGAHADNPYFPYQPAARPQAPDACGPGFTCFNYLGAPYGPNYYLRPPWAPFNGMITPPNWGGGTPAMFGTHPYARSARDFFMVEFR